MKFGYASREKHSRTEMFVYVKTFITQKMTLFQLHHTAEGFKELYASWKSGEITAVKEMQETGAKKTTFYKLVREYEKLLSYNGLLLNYTNFLDFVG